MTKLEQCKCGEKATIYSFTTKEWRCRYCQRELNRVKSKSPGFVLIGDGWPGKELKTLKGGNK